MTHRCARHGCGATAPADRAVTRGVRRLARARPEHQWLGGRSTRCNASRALRESPRPIEARFHLGEALWQLGRWTKRCDRGAMRWKAIRLRRGWQALAEALWDGQGAAALRRRKGAGAFRAEVRSRGYRGRASRRRAWSAARATAVADSCARNVMARVPARRLAGLARRQRPRPHRPRGHPGGVARRRASQLHPRLHAARASILPSRGRRRRVVRGDAHARPAARGPRRAASRRACGGTWPSPEAPALAAAYASMCRAFSVRRCAVLRGGRGHALADRRVATPQVLARSRVARDRLARCGTSRSPSSAAICTRGGARLALAPQPASTMRGLAALDRMS
jgi:hypothetical protein